MDSDMFFYNNKRMKKEQLLNLSISEKRERRRAARDFIFYLGECENKSAAFFDKVLLGQSWINFDDLDYVPSQLIDNKIKPLIQKQARFMFGRAPDILLKPLDKNNREICEELRQKIDTILDDNKFWSNTLKAFRLATITKRVLLRIEANPNSPIKLYYHSIDDFSYNINTDDTSELKDVTFVREDPNNADNEYNVSNQIWYRYTYYMKNNVCYLKIETFKGDNLDTPIDIKEQNTGLSHIPCWVIVNEQSSNNIIGCTDIKDLKPLQNAYNRRLSDFNDALRFLMFGQTAVIDGNEDDVNKCTIAPNSLMAIKTRDSDSSDSTRQATISRVESSFSNAEPVKMFLDMLDDSMHEKLAIPLAAQLKEVPSAKTIKYVYTELVARCDEKWNDWEPIIRNLITLIIESCQKFNCYSDWKSEWNSLKYFLVINKNYPIPEDEEDKKKLAMDEVQSKVRSHKSYIKEFSDDEDIEEEFNEILQETELLNQANDTLMAGTNSDIEDLNNQINGE
ncbi:phage portal protein [Clostridium butyricum]|uniref:phage portal protein n=1 Tax=Clostridium butyricum TaxID=1492 RepID=UPI00374F839E